MVVGQSVPLDGGIEHHCTHFNKATDRGQCLHSCPMEPLVLPPGAASGSPAQAGLTELRCRQGFSPARFQPGTSSGLVR